MPCFFAYAKMKQGGEHDIQSLYVYGHCHFSIKADFWWGQRKCHSCFLEFMARYECQAKVRYLDSAVRDLIARDRSAYRVDSVGKGFRTDWRVIHVPSAFSNRAYRYVVPGLCCSFVGSVRHKKYYYPFTPVASPSSIHAAVQFFESSWYDSAMPKAS